MLSELSLKRKKKKNEFLLCSYDIYVHHMHQLWRLIQILLLFTCFFALLIRPLVALYLCGKKKIFSFSIFLLHFHRIFTSPVVLLIGGYFNEYVYQINSMIQGKTAGFAVKPVRLLSGPCVHRVFSADLLLVRDTRLSSKISSTSGPATHTPSSEIVMSVPSPPDPVFLDFWRGAYGMDVTLHTH